MFPGYRLLQQKTINTKLRGNVANTPYHSGLDSQGVAFYTMQIIGETNNIQGALLVQAAETIDDAQLVAASMVGARTPPTQPVVFQSPGRPFYWLLDLGSGLPGVIVSFCAWGE